MCSGSDVVAAATMPPVGRKVSAFSTISDRSTSSRHSPRYEHCAAHASHHRQVRSTAASASIGWRARRFDGCHDSTNGTRSPARTVKEARVVRSIPRVCTGVHSESASGPPMAHSMPSTRRTHGTIEP